MMQAAELAVLDWLQALRLGGVDPDKIENELPYAGILLKKERGPHRGKKRQKPRQKRIPLVKRPGPVRQVFIKGGHCVY